MIELDLVEGVGDESHLAYLLKCEYSLIYQTPRFLRLISTHLSADAGWIIAHRNEDIAGLLPYVVKNGKLGPVFNSLAYFGSNGGVVQHQEDMEAKEKLINKFYELAEKNNACSATIITNPLLQDFTIYDDVIDHDFRDERIGQITHIPQSMNEEELDSIFQDPRPRNIRRALKAGVEFEVSRSRETIEFLFEIHEKGMKAKGGTPKKESFFKLFPKIMSEEDWAIYVAKLDGRPIAALLLFYFNETVEYFTPVIVYKMRSTQASSLIIYRAMQDAMSQGYKYWNWGGTWKTQDGVYNFKKKWNANDYPYYYYGKVFNQGLFQQDKSFLTSEYEGFYSIPYSLLNK